METTRQEIFDTVSLHLVTQGKRSILSTNLPKVSGVKCAYRSADGSKCAVGCLITDEEYSPNMELKSVTDLVVHKLLPERLLPHKFLLSRLQEIHDGTPDYLAKEEWKSSVKQNLRELGLVSGLQLPDCLK